MTMIYIDTIKSPSCCPLRHVPSLATLPSDNGFVLRVLVVLNACTGWEDALVRLATRLVFASLSRNQPVTYIRISASPVTAKYTLIHEFIVLSRYMAFTMACVWLLE